MTMTWILITCIAVLVAIATAALLLCFGGKQKRRKKLKNFKAVAAGDGQHGSQHWQEPEETEKTYKCVPFGREQAPGFLVGVDPQAKTWLVDNSDNSALILAPPGAGKSTSIYIPTIKYNAQVNLHTNGQGPSMVIMDVKGDLYRRLEPELRHAGYRTPVMDLRTIFRSSQYNLMYRVNQRMDAWAREKDPKQKALHYAVAERYAKVIAEAIIGTVQQSSSNDSSEYFNETARGLIIGLILLVSQYGEPEERHIISVFNLIVELSGSDTPAGFGQQRSRLALMMDAVEDRRIRGYVSVATSADIRTTLNIISSALSKLLKFIDAELEQELCSHDNELDAQNFVRDPTAIFLIVPDENETRNFLPALFIRFLTDDLITLAEVEYGGTLPRPYFCFFDEFGNYKVPGATSFFSAIRSRGGRVMAAIQSESQLFLKYSKEEANVIKDTCQLKYSTFVAPSAYETAKSISDMLGQETILTGSKNIQGTHISTSSQLMGRPLLAVAALVTLPRDTWIIQRGGNYPLKSRLVGYWQYIKLADGDAHILPERGYLPVHLLTPDQLQAKLEGRFVPLQLGMFDEDSQEDVWMLTEA